jgi:hypothetical protein
MIRKYYYPKDTDYTLLYINKMSKRIRGCTQPKIKYEKRPFHIDQPLATSRPSFGAALPPQQTQ